LKRGEVWWADLGPYRPQEQTGRRPVIVWQSDTLTRVLHSVLWLLAASFYKRAAHSGLAASAASRQTGAGHGGDARGILGPGLSAHGHAPVRQEHERAVTVGRRRAIDAGVGCGCEVIAALGASQAQKCPPQGNSPLAPMCGCYPDGGTFHDVSATAVAQVSLKCI
jgi:hypothetical protein